MKKTRDTSDLHAAAEAYNQALGSAIAPAVIQTVMDELPSAITLLLSAMPSGINLWKAYPTKAAASYLGLEASSLSRISEFELPRQKVGPSRGSNVYFGINILCYLVGLPPVDVRGLVERFRSDLLREAERPTKVQTRKHRGRPAEIASAQGRSEGAVTTEQLTEMEERLVTRLRAELMAIHLGGDMVISESEAAQLIGIHPKTLYKMRAAGEVPHGMIGKTARYSLAQVRQLMREISQQ